jgi:hypothetical protein
MAVIRKKARTPPELLSLEELGLLCGMLASLVEEALADATDGIVPGKRWQRAALAVLRRQERWRRRPDGPSRGKVRA